MRTRTLCLAALLTGVAAQAAPADIFLMNVPGVSGDVTLVRYEGWISVTSFAGAFANSSSPAPARAHASAPASCEQLRVVKALDVASPALAMAVATEQLHPEAALVVVDSGTGSEFLRFTLRNVVISSTAFGGDSSTSARTEMLTLKPQQIELSYVPQNPDGSPGAPIATVIDCSGVS